jgi:anti-sigma factor RsiW
LIPERCAPSCDQIQSSFSAYLDGAVSGHEMQEIARHLEGSVDSGPACDVCAQEFTVWRRMQESLAALGPAKAPADLGLKLRLAISREQARRSAHWFDPISLAWDNTVRPMLLQVSAATAGAVVLVGGIALLLGAVAVPQAVLADDEPLGAITAPHYLYSTVSVDPIVTENDAPVVVEASVDSTGRVYDYKIVSGPEDSAVRTQVANQLVDSFFKPASVFGMPVRGRVVITFAGISVRG